MSSHTILDIDGYDLLDTARYADETVLTVFRESDKYLEVVRIADDLSRTVLPKQVGSDFEVDEEDEQISVGYRASGKIVRDRLDVMGFTLDATRSVFERGILARLERLTEWAADDEHNLWSHDIEMLKQISFDRWLSTFADIKARGATHWSTSSELLRYTKLTEPIQIDEMGRFLIGRDGEYPFQFPSVDIRFFLRAVVEACGDASILRQELDEVVAAGYYWYEESIAEKASVSLREDFPLNSRIIVLTEGVTDRRALERALGLLYPHLSDYFGFMDFEGAAIAGGAGPLVATVKAFAGAGVANRVIALFDNDSAARVAVRALERIDLPPSIKIAHYPPLPLLESYPTLGPSGAALMDVNGLAGSIEMYFGEDVLRDSTGELTPILWKNYESSIGTYHGEVANKISMQRRFDEKLATARTESDPASQLDWSGMQSILSSLVGAFVNEPSEIPDD
jgi:hypothetical protein